MSGYLADVQHRAQLAEKVVRSEEEADLAKARVEKGTTSDLPNLDAQSARSKAQRGPCRRAPRNAASRWWLFTRPWAMTARSTSPANMWPLRCRVGGDSPAAGTSSTPHFRCVVPSLKRVWLKKLSPPARGLLGRIKSFSRRGRDRGVQSDSRKCARPAHLALTRIRTLVVGGSVITPCG